MNAPPSPALPGRVVSLHLHPAEPGAALRTVDELEVVEGKGVRRDARYFGRISQHTGQASLRQVSLIEREQIAEHATSLGLSSIAPGAVRANIETEGVNLIALLGREIQIGEAILLLYEARRPCHKMDAVCAGLRGLMENSKQGVLAQVLRTGSIRTGDVIAECTDINLKP